MFLMGMPPRIVSSARHHLRTRTWRVSPSFTTMRGGILELLGLTLRSMLLQHCQSTGWSACQRRLGLRRQHLSSDDATYYKNQTLCTVRQSVFNIPTSSGVTYINKIHLISRL